MPFTIGHAQKAILISAKHQWAHGLYAPGAFPIPPTDAKVLNIAQTQVRRSGGRPIATEPSWSKADSLGAIRAFWDLQEQAAAGRMAPAVWELFAFNVGAGPSIVTITPSASEVASRQAAFLDGNNRAADPGSPLPQIRSKTKEDALKSTFTQQTWPWRPPVSEMTTSQRQLKVECEQLLKDEAWRMALKYTTRAAGMNRAEVEVDLVELRDMIRSRFHSIL